MIKRVTIQGRVYEVREVSGLESDNESIDGLCTFDDRLIEIRAEVKRAEKQKVLIHEMVHAVLHECHLTCHDAWVDDLVEEVICDAVAGMICENFRLTKRT